MKPSFEVKMTQEALFEFLMFHTYHGIKGILYLIVGVGCWLGAIASWSWTGSCFCNLPVYYTDDLKVQCRQSDQKK